MFVCPSIPKGITRCLDQAAQCLNNIMGLTTPQPDEVGAQSSMTIWNSLKGRVHFASYLKYYMTLSGTNYVNSSTSNDILFLSLIW